jgi:EpsI family protein
MTSEWIHDPDMGHGLLVPAAAVWIGFEQRQRLAASARPSAWGIAFVLAGAALQFLGAISFGLFVGSLGFLCALLGILVAAGGFAWLRILAFPLFLLLFMLPKPEFAWSRVAVSLQLLASQLAAGMARLAGTSVLREGNVLQVSGRRIAVEEACNGIRYLLSLGFVALLWGHVAGLRGWRRALVGAGAVPVAILVNALRVAAVAVMSRYDYRLAMGVFHEASGWAALGVGLVLIGFTVRAVRRLPAGASSPQELVTVSPSVRRVWLVAVAAILALQCLPTFAAPLVENPPRLAPLSQFPEKLGAWTMTGPEAIPAAELAGLKADDSLARFYGEMELRVAYNRSQRHGRLPHAPRVCLPANGWTPLESRVVWTPGGEVNLFVAAKGAQRVTVLYWYQTAYQVFAAEWKRGAWAAVNGILHRRTDVALVRVVAAGTAPGREAALAFAPLVMAEMQARLR